MSYCRWSDCDVYVYESSDGGWKTHVAGRRLKAGKGPDYDFTSPEAFARSVEVLDKWFKENTEYVDLTAPSAGESFIDNTPGECADRLIALRGEGLDVPQYAIDALREEQAELDATA